MSQKTVIIITPYPEFGEVVSQSLIKNMAWNVDLVCTSKAVADLISNYRSLNYALIDMELSFDQVRESVFIIRDKFPGTEITLISKKEPPEEAEDLRPWRLLTKPFVESDLLELFRYSSESQSNIVIDGNFSDAHDMSLPAWARDKESINKIMINSIALIDAQEAILFAENKVLSHAGTVKGTDIDDCSKIVHKYLDSNDTGEIIKYVNINSSNYLLHATILAVGIILAILYRPDTPYRDVRYQTRFIETGLVSPKLSSLISNALPERIKRRSEKPNQLSRGSSRKVLNDGTKKSPHPRPTRKFAGKRDNVNKVEAGKRVVPSGLQPPHFDNKMESSPAYKTLFSRDEPGSSHISGLRTIRDTLQLYYSCLLIPRFKSHFITNDLARFLDEEIPSIFQANGWRLESLIIDELYMMWIALIPPTVAPTTHIKTIRKESSKLILQNFVKYSRDGMIVDFWAPGSLLEPGNQEISDRDITEFIHANRRQYYPDEK